MATFPLKFSLLFFLLTTLTSISLTTSTPTLGVTIHHLPPESISTAFNRSTIAAVLLIDPNPDANLIRAFSYSNSSSVSLLLTIPNTLVRSNAAVWFYPRANISAISVGSDVLSSPYDLAGALLPAIRNVHVALHQLGIRKISVSTTFSVLPPYSAEFGEPANDAVIRPFLDFLDVANSSFLVTINPYNLYRWNHEIVLGYALFQYNLYGFIHDPTTGLWCQNTLVFPALAVSGNENFPLAVTETSKLNSPANFMRAEISSGSKRAEMSFWTQFMLPLLMALSFLMAYNPDTSSEVNTLPRKDVCIKCNQKEEESIIFARGKYNKNCNRGSNKPYVCSRCRSSRGTHVDLEVDMWGCKSDCSKTFSTYNGLELHVSSSHKGCKVCPPSCAAVINIDDTAHVCLSRYYSFNKLWYKKY